jgi:hypothetical protein
MEKANPEKLRPEIRAHCQRVRKKLVEHLDDQLSQDERRAVDEHLRACPHCSAERAALKRTLGLMGQRILPDPDPAFWTALRYRVRRETKQTGAVPPLRPPIPARAWVPAVAFAALVVFLFLWWSSLPQLPAPGQSPLLAQLEQEGLRSLQELRESPIDIEDLQVTRTPGDSLVELLAVIPRPLETLERALVRENMLENPELWEMVVEEELAADFSLEAVLEDLTEEQLKELSAKLRNLMG